MRLNPQPFEMIKSRQKTIELRLYDEKRRKIKSGDIIKFINSETGSYIVCQVSKLHIFSSFAELYNNLPLLRCGYTEEDIGTADAKDMDEYYTPNEQKKYSVVGIELNLLSC